MSILSNVHFRGQCQPHLTENEKTVARIHDSVEQLNSYLSHGNSVYGEPFTFNLCSFLTL